MGGNKLYHVYGSPTCPHCTHWDAEIKAPENAPYRKFFKTFAGPGGKTMFVDYSQPPAEYRITGVPAALECRSDGRGFVCDGLGIPKQRHPKEVLVELKGGSFAANERREAGGVRSKGSRFIVAVALAVGLAALFAK